MRALLLSVLLAAAPALAAPPPPEGADDATAALASGRFAEIAAELELTEAQRKQVTDAVYAANTAKVDLDARAEKARLELRHLLGADTVDEKAVLKAVDTLSAAEAELRRNRVQLVLSIRKALTAEQWRELAAIRQERRSDRRGHED